MDINTKDGFKEAVKECLTELLTQSPILKQTDAGGGNSPVYLADGMLTECDVAVNWNTYNSVRQIGLSSDATIAEVYAVLPDNSILISAAWSGADVPNNNTAAQIIIYKSSEQRSSIFYYGKTYAIGDYRMYLDGDANIPDGTWHKITVE